ncbi:uncharacterized protein LOC121369456 [Gigantopelta aegis]|uniref:uncharacterized protein LOC121369456 n=1 Tax=Gigantopelta aegis TaxID=1735272 RepID=UPI001B88B531|nr:uncharacterized protein LOC121369456 [Gigantopelta aegis]
MYSRNSDRLPTTSTTDNPIIFQQVTMDTSQQWVPIGKSLCNLKNILAVSVESSTSGASSIPNHLPRRSTTSRNSTGYRTRKLKRFGISSKFDDHSASGITQNNNYALRHMTSSWYQNAKRYSRVVALEERFASREGIVYADPWNSIIEEYDPWLNVCNTSKADKGSNARVNLPNKSDTSICDVKLSWTPAAVFEGVQTIYGIVIPSSADTTDDVTTELPLDITELTAQLTVSCHTALHCIDPEAYQSDFVKPVAESASTRDAARSSGHLQVDEADVGSSAADEDRYCQWIVDEWLDQIRVAVCGDTPEQADNPVDQTTKRKHQNEATVKSESEELKDIFTRLQSREHKWSSMELYELNQSQLVLTNNKMDTKKTRLTRHRQKRNIGDLFQNKESPPTKFFKFENGKTFQYM